MPRSIHTSYLAGHIEGKDALDAFVDVYAWPAAPEFEDIFDDVYPMRGSRHYTNTDLWLQKVMARQYRGTVNAARAAARAGREPARRAFLDRHGVLLPEEPPPPQVVDKLFHRLAARPDAIEALNLRMIEVAAAQLRTFGHFLPNSRADFANPDSKHLVIGDGMIWRPYSDVRFDGVGQLGRWGYEGSEATAKHRVRYQRAGRNPADRELDHAGMRGINHVTLYAWTEHGTVVFGTDMTTGAEQEAAGRLVKSVHAELGDTFHFLAYDRVYNGHLRHELMAEHGICVLNKEYAASKRYGSDTRIWLRERAVEYAQQMGLYVTGETEAALMKEVALRLIQQHSPLPLGVNLYPTAESYEAVNGKVRHYGLVVPQDPSHRCQQDLWSDNGALWVVEDKVKTGRCVPLRSHTTRTDSGMHAQHTDWTVPCPHGGFEHHSVWYPPQLREQTKRGNSRRQQALDDIRIPSRHDPAFKIAWRRNTSESANEVAERTTQHHKRATSYLATVQRLDMLCIAQLLNSAAAQNGPDRYTP